jgi:CRP/FNR family cyclic AMP-dependent transcriptional regulator
MKNIRDTGFQCPGREAIMAQERGKPGRGNDHEGLLADHWIFDGIPAERLTPLSERMRTRRFSRGQIIFQRGDEGSALYAVKSGQIKISVTSGDGKEIVLNIMRDGDLFGEIALLDGGPRTADAQAMVASELLVLDRRDFVAFLERTPSVALNLIKVIAGRLRNTSEQVEDVAAFDRAARLARALLRLAERFGEETEEGVRLDLTITQSDIGNLVGMPRESMNKQLSEWRAAGIILFERGVVTIKDSEALDDLAIGDF